MAVHGEALLEQAQLFPTLEAALADCRRVVATSGRIEEEALPLNGPAEALSWLQASDTDASSAPAALVFGREDRGLSNAELLQAGRILRLETSEAYASMNLSHAVAVCLHELRRCPAPTAPSRSPASGSNWRPHSAMRKTCCWRWASFIPIPPRRAWPSCGRCCNALRSATRKSPCCGEWCVNCAGHHSETAPNV